MSRQPELYHWIDTVAMRFPYTPLQGKSAANRPKKPDCPSHLCNGGTLGNPAFPKLIFIKWRSATFRPALRSGLAFEVNLLLF